MKVYIVYESYCGDESSVHKIFKTHKSAANYIREKDTETCRQCDGKGFEIDTDDDTKYDCTDCNGKGVGYNKDIHHYFVSSCGYEVED